MYIGTMAHLYPDRQAVVVDDGAIVMTYAELDARSRQVARMLAGLGCSVGDTVAVMLANGTAFFEVWWAAMRTGLYLTPVNWHLTAAEVEHQVRDSEAKVLVHEAHLAAVVAAVVANDPRLIAVAVGDDEPALSSLAYERLVRDQPSSELDGETAGTVLPYSSGTTGRPKGIRRPLSGRPPAEGVQPLNLVMDLHRFEEGDRFLTPCPLYHSAGFAFGTGMHCVGATTIVMTKFDAARALAIIEHQGVTKSLWVPTMFKRLLELPEEAKHAHDLSDHRLALHAAAPTPIEMKERMIDWWGPILREFYGGTEGGGTMIESDEWLTHRGSVGRHWAPGGITHILDPETLEELPPGEEGLVYFDGMAPTRFEYLNDREKTSETWLGDRFTIGDIGYVDEDNYLYLTDRRTNLIIAGGVNIYPREIEDVLVMHPQIADVGVIGMPHDDLGEQVVAFVQLQPGVTGDDEVAAGILRFASESLARFKVPRQLRFVDVLPRDANGKLYKRRLVAP